MTTQQKERVQATGVFFAGVCEVKVDERCETKGGKPRPISAIWMLGQGKRQVDVCNLCMDEKINRGDWILD